MATSTLTQLLNNDCAVAALILKVTDRNVLILLKSEGVHQVELMYLSQSMSHARQVRVTIGDSGFCCYVRVTFFEGLLGATTGAVRRSPVNPHTHVHCCNHDDQRSPANVTDHST